MKLTCLALGAMLLVFGGESAPAQTAPASFEATQGVEQDARVTTIVTRLRDMGHRGFVAITNARLVDPDAGRIIEAQTIVVRGERIAWVGPAGEAPNLTGAYVIDAHGAYLSPGLADMHVHSTRMGENVLRLAAGVTTVRDMDGAPWMLRLRDEIASDRMVGAADYVMGTILADQPLDGYAVVVHTPAEARLAVQQQALCGYGAIKIHNSLAMPLMDAIAAESERVGLDLIGHVPHEISLDHAIHSAHMRTLEHLKGFLLDRNFLPSDEDFAAALRGADVWITPTFYTGLDRAYGAEAARRIADPRARFEPRRSREYWAAHVPASNSRDASLYDLKERTIRAIMPRLLPLHPHWLVGTDAAGYPFNIAGYAALDEMQMMHDEGIPTLDVIRGATTEAAAALHQEREFGRIRAGERADLVLLASNPLTSVSAYSSNEGVMARGRWYDRPALDTAENALAAIYAEPINDAYLSTQADAIAASVDRLIGQGFAFDARALSDAADELANAGHSDAAQRLRASAALGVTSACLQEHPR